MRDLRLSIERDAGKVIVSVRDRAAPHAGFTLTTSARAGAAVAATLSAAIHSDDTEFSSELTIGAELALTKDREEEERLP